MGCSNRWRRAERIYGGIVSVEGDFIGAGAVWSEGWRATDEYDFGGKLSRI
ncbi:MAG: hypothetical protein UX01_C0004G0093 [Candidatus Collierbacteria bacterium GW2011_GWB2_45_17]|uniref:Uncharacterized protein n=2 Tax=Candidatus Collieribacteriota TaxID=1752725 RepID=A0A0G1KM45_9BACT|nr:MAG: hypothetical protein UW48_C0002G0010 [Microgenomates group bacterium GW2011_GWC1_44_23]KKT84751.1 MAG: hypothetical protein UW84_C0050G0009 [Candidatus Collierbacteria bacterium GW2011_GWA2_44_99]KKT95574.1 MAG: hypothetical protein UW96_C0006G0005 [Candidatus Collierbacteria bacterium GW2011_GWA1_45_15]KKU00526.1 MAG: hypothetical protein UX01_C0004G0093 [Candidatus Collierbacteria bacterium GW2011_GWB2_45_17]KKU08239.1 MAG: hypothetical protein UX11_C0006G0095 [Candidatus Collierbacte